MRGKTCISSFALHKIKKERRVLNLILCKALAEKTTARIKNGHCTCEVVLPENFCAKQMVA